MDNKEIREAARSVVAYHKLNDYVEYGSVGAAVLSASGKIYTGSIWILPAQSDFVQSMQL